MTIKDFVNDSSKLFFRVTTTDNSTFTLSHKDLSKSLYLSSLHKIGDDVSFRVCINSDIFTFILDFMQIEQKVLHKEYTTSTIYFPLDHIQWVRQKNQKEILDICNACNYLEYPYLMELCCKVLADDLMGLKDEEIENMCI